MKKQLALGIAGASAALVGGWRLVNQLVNRGGGQTDPVSVAPGMPAEAFTDPATEAPAESEKSEKGPAKSSAGSPGKSAGGPATATKKSSKAELYEIAQDLGIEGRSKMTKEELLSAIQRAR